MRVVVNSWAGGVAVDSWARGVAVRGLMGLEGFVGGVTHVGAENLITGLGVDGSMRII